ncbi:lysozyme inhibitor LprI family protein [Psychrobacillus antarcticus]|uniref:lysozyme inhibitor LprI family protein n=1 Tax=Psychrobacillus antarcticus TaxID=2879115 RepID=UPI002407A04F|nr:lysozyme inhibitor LprI family protein [Psychrobacillus antarcticus]
MKNLLVFLMPFILLAGCNDETEEKDLNTEKLGNETVIEEPNDETELEVIEEEKSNIIEEGNVNTTLEKPAVQGKPVTTEKPETVNLSGTKEKYLEQLNKIEDGLSDLNKQYEDGSQTEMHEAKSEILSKWDDALNEIYGVLQKQLSTNEMSSLKEEQRNWIIHRDQKATEESAVFEGGTMETVQYLSTRAQLTKERCYELVQNYMK